MYTQTASSLRQLQQLPATYVTPSSARSFLPGRMDITSAALTGLNLFLDDMLYQLLDTCDGGVRGHDGTGHELVRAMDDALGDLLPAGLARMIRDRSAERVAFAMLSQPTTTTSRRSRSRTLWGRKWSKTARGGTGSEDEESSPSSLLLSAVDRFPHLRQHCVQFMNDHDTVAAAATDRHWELAVVVLACEFLRSMALTALKGAVLLMRQSQRATIDVNEILSALSGDAQLAPLFNTMHSCSWMAEMVQTQVTEARPERELSNVHNYRIREHRSLGNLRGRARVDDMREFISDPMAPVTSGGTGYPSPSSQPSSPLQSPQLKSPTFSSGGSDRLASENTPAARSARRPTRSNIFSRLFKSSASSAVAPPSQTTRR